MYMLYEIRDNLFACAFTHLHRWIISYRGALNMDLAEQDPLLPSADNLIKKLSVGYKMNTQNFMKTNVCHGSVI